MNKLRQDGWSKDDDVLLAEIVLRHIRNGKTQLDAFKLAGEKLARTSAACGFRWNATVRQQYEDAIYLAKNSRKRTNKNEMNAGSYIDRSEREDSINSAISLLHDLKNQVHQSEERTENENIHKLLKEENKLLKKEIKRYQEAWKEMSNVWEWIEKEK